VAGIAAGDGDGVALANAQAAGVAPAANIIAIQVFHRRETNCTGNRALRRRPVSDQIAGLDRVFDLRNDFTIVAANMSLGGGDFTAACDADQAARKTAIDALIGANIATVDRVGQQQRRQRGGAPACISTAVAVGATDNADNVTRNRGPLLDLFAPGSGIWSAAANTGFESKGGTSMAAPHVAGAWAILRQVYPGASVAEILNVLQTTGVPITYDSGGGTNNVTTPRIDLLAAVQASADPPTLTVDDASVTVDEGQTATNTGPSPTAPPRHALGLRRHVTDEGGGAWSWSFDRRRTRPEPDRHDHRRPTASPRRARSPSS
jgi:subtilisin family serine protease